MNKPLKLIAMLCVFALVAYIVNIAGKLAMSDSPINALIPVAILLTGVVAYIRYRDKKD
jgi:hypothetical protein